MTDINLAELANQTGNFTGTMPQELNIFDWIIGLGFGGISGFFFIFPVCYCLFGDDSYTKKFFWGFYLVFSVVFAAAFNYYGRIAVPIDSLMFLMFGIVVALFINLIRNEF